MYYSIQILYSSCVQFSTLQRSFINFWLTCKKNFEQYVSIVLLVSSTIASGQKKCTLITGLYLFLQFVIIFCVVLTETSTRLFRLSQIFSKIAKIKKKLKKPTQGASQNYMSENAITQHIAKKIQLWLSIIRWANVTSELFSDQALVILGRNELGLFLYTMLLYNVYFESHYLGPALAGGYFARSYFKYTNII